MAWQADPARYDVLVVIGDTWLIGVVLDNDDGTAVDLTDVTGVASIRTEIGGAEVAAPTVTVTDAEAGTLTVGLTAEQTADLQVGSYRWSCRIDFGSSTKTILEGTVTVRRLAVEA